MRQTETISHSGEIYPDGHYFLHSHQLPRVSTSHIQEGFIPTDINFLHSNRLPRFSTRGRREDFNDGIELQRGLFGGHEVLQRIESRLVLRLPDEERVR